MQKEEWSDNLIPESDISRAVKDVDFVIEAVPEKMDLKKGIIQEFRESLSGKLYFSNQYLQSKYRRNRVCNKDP